MRFHKFFKLLARGEFCILINRKGEKRYVNGPALVVRRIGERFCRSNGSTTFQAYNMADEGRLTIIVSPENIREITDAS